MMNRKGSAWIEYTLATFLFVGLAVVLITWGRGFTQEKTDAAITMASGRMDCQQIKLDAKDLVDDDAQCTLNLANRGSLNIKKVLIRYGDTQQEVSDLKIADIILRDSGSVTDGVALTLPTAGKVEFIPLVESGTTMVGCKDKVLEITCS